jgi:quercetin dioxygenase-like cupin family protein
MKYIVEAELQAGAAQNVDELRAMLARWQGLSPAGIYLGLNDQEVIVILDVPDKDALSEALQVTSALAKEYPRVRPVTDVLQLPGGVPQGKSIPGVTVHSVVSSVGGRAISPGVFDLDVGVVTVHHVHDWSHKILALSGRGKIHVRNRSWNLVAGDVAFILSAEDHYLENTGDNIFRFLFSVCSLDELQAPFYPGGRLQRVRHPDLPPRL